MDNKPVLVQSVRTEKLLKFTGEDMLNGFFVVRKGLRRQVKISHGVFIQFNEIETFLWKGYNLQK